MPTSYIKVRIAGPFLPEENQLIENLSFINEPLPSGLVWEEGVKNLKTEPTAELAGISIEDSSFKLHNSVVIILKVSHKNNSLKESVDIATIQMKQLISLLSIFVNNGKYYFKFLKSSIVDFSPNTLEIEGPASLTKRVIFFQKNHLTKECVKFINQISKNVTQRMWHLTLL